MSARAGEAKELSRLLGEDHDYSVLLAFAEGQAGKLLEPRHVAALSNQCRSCQSELRAMARPRGERLFVERAGELAKRVTLYWTSARRLAALAPADREGADGALLVRKPRAATRVGRTKAASKAVEVPARSRYRRRGSAEA
jgi:hypothetical protein